MPLAGLSLVGFMEEQFAINYLRSNCILPDTSDAALRQCWNDGRAKLGLPTTNAGRPNIQSIPPGHDAYLRPIATHPRLTINPGIVWSFKLVEIRPLLAYQFHVVTERSSSLCAGITGIPQLADMLPICLPHNFEQVQFEVTSAPQSVVLRSRPLNARVLGAGPIGSDSRQMANFVGIAFGVGNPWVAVVRVNGRCFLHNGYHRAHGLQVAGATHMPVLFADVPDYMTAGVVGGTETFAPDLLESPNPPTCAHLTNARSYPVILKRMSRIIHVTWAQYAVPED